MQFEQWGLAVSVRSVKSERLCHHMYRISDVGQYDVALFCRSTCSKLYDDVRERPRRQRDPEYLPFQRRVQEAVNGPGNCRSGEEYRLYSGRTNKRRKRMMKGCDRKNSHTVTTADWVRGASSPAILMLKPVGIGGGGCRWKDRQQGKRRTSEEDIRYGSSPLPPWWSSTWL